MVGHILRIRSRRSPKVAISWTPADSKWRRGCPKENMVQKISRRSGEGWHRLGRGWTHCNGLSRVKLLPNVPTGTGGTYSKSKN